MADDQPSPTGAANPSIMATLASWKAGRAKLRTEGAAGVADAAAAAASAGGGAPVTAGARPAKFARVGPAGVRARSTPPPPEGGTAGGGGGGTNDNNNNYNNNNNNGGAPAGAAATGSAAAAAPLAKQVKDALAVLRAAEGRPLTADDMRAAGLPASYDLTPGGRLHAELVRQPRVAQTTRGAAPAGGGGGGAGAASSSSSSGVVVRLAYRSEHGIRDADALLRHIRARPAGTKASDVRDAYRAVLDDADALVARGFALRQYSHDAGCDVYFPADMRARPAVALPAEAVRLYHEVEVPTEPAELTASLRRQGLPSALSTLQRRKVPPLERALGARRRRQQAPRNVTNAHLPELFRGAQPEAIDKR